MNFVYRGRAENVGTLLGNAQDEGLRAFADMAAQRLPGHYSEFVCGFNGHAGYGALKVLTPAHGYNEGGDVHVVLSGEALKGIGPKRAREFYDEVIAAEPDMFLERCPQYLMDELRITEPSLGERLGHLLGIPFNHLFIGNYEPGRIYGRSDRFIVDESRTQFKPIAHPHFFEDLRVFAPVNGDGRRRIVTNYHPRTDREGCIYRGIWVTDRGDYGNLAQELAEAIPHSRVSIGQNVIHEVVRWEKGAVVPMAPK